MSRCLIIITPWLFSFGFLLPSLAFSAETASTLLIQEARKLNLAHHQTWLKLLHYDGHRSKKISAIKSTQFFLSPHGQTEPEEELEATINSFTLAFKLNGDTHAICRFPARYLWLSTQLNLQFIAKPVCPGFNEWSQHNNIESISLLYASGYLGNPASYYGHTLLKLNAKDSQQSTLLDMTTNYGAIVPDNEDPISYMFKGVFGSYDGAFSKVGFYFHEQSYGELELRDIWEYELNLSSYDVSLIVGHLWELLDQQYTYYFFKENCAYRVAEILELSSKLQLLPKNRFFTFPQTIITNLNKNVLEGKTAIKNVFYHPSRQSRLYQKYDSLTSSQKLMLHAVSENINILDSEVFSQETTLSQRTILSTYQDYLKFLEVTNDDISADTQFKYNQSLSKQFTLPIQHAVRSKTVEPPSPHTARDPSYSQFSYVYNEKHGKGLVITIRPSYYDSLDSHASLTPSSTLSMFSSKLSYFDKQLLLRQLNFISVESVGSPRTKLKGDNNKAWKLQLSLEQQNLSCEHCLVMRFQGDLGLAKQLNDSSTVGMYIGAAVQNNRNGYGVFYPKASLFANVTLPAGVKLHALYEKRHHLDSNLSQETIVQFEGRYPINQHLDTRLKIETNKTTEYSLSLGYYW